MVWIIGEYSSRIDNADELLEAFSESFMGVLAAPDHCYVVVNRCTHIGS